MPTPTTKKLTPTEVRNIKLMMKDVKNNPSKYQVKPDNIPKAPQGVQAPNFVIPQQTLSQWDGVFNQKLATEEFKSPTFLNTNNDILNFVLPHTPQDIGMSLFGTPSSSMINKLAGATRIVNTEKGLATKIGNKTYYSLDDIPPSVEQIANSVKVEGKIPKKSFTKDQLIKEAYKNSKVADRSLKSDFDKYISNFSPSFKAELPEGTQLNSFFDLDRLKKYLPGKQSSSFKSEIDWAKWNEEIPNNAPLMKEYNAIEETSKANGTWMKNLDGSAFQGTPEQFVQQNSENFKKAFPKGQNTVYRGDMIGDVHLTGDVGDNRTIFTADKETGQYYAGSKGHLFELYHPKSANNINFDNNGRSWRNISRTHFGENPPKLDVLSDRLNTPQKGNYTSTDDIAEWIQNNNKDYVNIENIFDGTDAKFVRMINHKPNNYLKSAIGNNGMFDMSNPNIYKALIPTIMAGTTGTLGLKTLQAEDKQRFEDGGHLPQYGDSGFIEFQMGKKIKSWLGSLGVPNYTDAGNFNQAFAAARKDYESDKLKGDVFIWNGERYNIRKDTDPIQYKGDYKGNYEEYKQLDLSLREGFPEFFKTLNRGRNVGTITFKGSSKKQPDRASIDIKAQNSNINVGEKPITTEFMGNMIAEAAHLKDKTLNNIPFSNSNLKIMYDHLRFKKNKYDIPGTIEYNTHRIYEPPIAIQAFGDLSPADIKRIQKYVGTIEDGYFGEKTWKALQEKYKDRKYIQETLKDHQLYTSSEDKNPINMGDFPNLAYAYLQELSRDVPIKQSDRFDGQGYGPFPFYSDEALLNTDPKDMNIKVLQRSLSYKGYNLPKSTTEYGDLDGIYGDETKNALLDWRTKNKNRLGNYTKKVGSSYFTPDFKYGGQLPQYGDGGEINSLEGNAISQVLMNRNRNLGFVDRAYNPQKYQSQHNPDGSISSHLMAYEFDETGQAYMFPTMSYNMDENNRPIESIAVPNQYADYISSVGYKKATGMIKPYSQTKTEKKKMEIGRYLQSQKELLKAGKERIREKTKTLITP